MAPIQHQQIGEGEAFVEPLSAETAKGLLAAAEELELDPSVVRTQLGGFLAPADVVAKWQEGDTGDAEVTTPDGPVTSTELVPPAKNASKGDWVAFAAEHHGYDEAEELTKDQLIERYGASE